MSFSDWSKISVDEFSELMAVLEETAAAHGAVERVRYAVLKMANKARGEDSAVQDQLRCLSDKAKALSAASYEFREEIKSIKRDVADMTKDGDWKLWWTMRNQDYRQPSEK